jgi:hypothetical protein
MLQSSVETNDPHVKGGVLDLVNQINAKTKETLFQTSSHSVMFHSLDSIATKMKPHLEIISTYQNFELLPDARFLSSIFSDILNIFTKFHKEFEKNFSTQDSSSINKKQYFKLKEETEIYLYLHLQELMLISKFIEESKNSTKPKYDLLDEDATDFWHEMFGEITFAVDKPEFLNEMKKMLKDECDETLICLIDSTSDGIVSVGDFQLFISWFGPFKDCLKNATKMLKLPYFYGSMTTSECQNVLDSFPLGTYLIRFNEKIPSFFLNLFLRSIRYFLR